MGLSGCFASPFFLEQVVPPGNRYAAQTINTLLKNIRKTKAHTISGMSTNQSLLKKPML